ncbi:Histidine transport system permease protein HisQ [Marinomonas spartinae]|uniref:Histidine transport system permease protein HisQ n=1 Tax=Marinomonas spartinae TaxID=1792290 RepID=A0A1A8T5B5_9GAMM|nr:ABC transporter permease subunit [Marinomonas spartinae]SBS26153.1 Histidine transport system permease protein HisQ [Marinomonas spartinae]SBS39995.1 Histidine transport system permease protein HisQ [Marinomonas spartinae]
MSEWITLLGFSDQGWGISLLKGMLVTLQISIGAFIVGLVIGVLTALAKLHGSQSMKVIARGYTTVCRAVPELLLILLLYYSGSHGINILLQALGFPEVDIGGVPVAIVVLGLVQGAYASEIIRSSILAVPHGQIEAATCMGMTRQRVFWRMTLPMMAPFALSGLANLWVSLVKDSALISVVGTNELLYNAKQAAGSTHSYLTFFLAAAALYYVINLVSNAALRRVELRFRRWMP